jgi:hypothetical protein
MSIVSLYPEEECMIAQAPDQQYNSAIANINNMAARISKFATVAFLIAAVTGLMLSIIE